MGVNLWVIDHVLNDRPGVGRGQLVCDPLCNGAFAQYAHKQSQHKRRAVRTEILIAQIENLLDYHGSGRGYQHSFIHLGKFGDQS